MSSDGPINSDEWSFFSFFKSTFSSHSQFFVINSSSMSPDIRKKQTSCVLMRTSSRGCSAHGRRLQQPVTHPQPGSSWTLIGQKDALSPAPPHEPLPCESPPWTSPLKHLTSCPKFAVPHSSSASPSQYGGPRGTKSPGNNNNSNKRPLWLWCQN